MICPSVAARNAPEHAGTYDDELALLLVHGILHLLGMDHIEEADAEKMEARERELLEEFHRSVVNINLDLPARRDLARVLRELPGAGRNEHHAHEQAQGAQCWPTRAAGARANCCASRNSPRSTSTPSYSSCLVRTLRSPRSSVSWPRSVFGPWGVALGVVFEIGFLFVVGEAAPKTWAVLNGERAALLVSRPVVLHRQLSAACGFSPAG